MARFIALLRGVNVGKAKRVPMAERASDLDAIVRGNPLLSNAPRPEAGRQPTRSGR